MKVKSVKPVAHRVVVRLRKLEEVSEGGIVIAAGENKNRQQVGVEEAYIEAVGPNAFKDFGSGEAWCKEGDLVAIVKYSGKDYRIGEDIYRIINDEDIMAIIEVD